MDLRRIAVRAIATCAAGLWVVSPLIARADDDPLHEVLKSKQLADMPQKKGHYSRLKYPMGPWFTKGSNMEQLFSEPQFAKKLITWLAPAGKQYEHTPPEADFEETHVHVETVMTERKTGKRYTITVLVPHPSFQEMVDGKLVNDFARREPPDLHITGSNPIRVQNFNGTVYLLRSERCSALFKLAKDSEIEIRSADQCGDFEAIKALAQALEMQRFIQRLQS